MNHPIDLRQLERDGYAIARNVLEPDALARLLQRIAELPSHSACVRDKAVFAQRNLLDHDWVRELSMSAALMQLVAPVLGGDAVAVRGILFDKIPEANWVVPWHQDLSIAVRERIDVAGYGPWSKKLDVVHVQPPARVLARMCTLRLHVDDCDLDNGPLRVIPGSHHGIWNRDEIAGISQAHQAVACTVPAGGVLMMRPMLVHASSPATNPGHRRVIHLEYAADELEGGLSWHASTNVTALH